MKRLPSLSFSVREVGKGQPSSAWPSVVSFPSSIKGHREFSIENALPKRTIVWLVTIDLTKLMNTAEPVLH